MSSNGSFDGVCCREEMKMVQCTMKALEKMRDMFQAALGPVPGMNPLETHDSVQQNINCTMKERCQIPACPLRRDMEFAPNTLRELCAKDRTSTVNNTRKDRHTIRLKPGEMGLRGDRATVHLGVGETAAKGAKPKTNRDGRPTGAMYYQMRPGMDDYMQRDHVIQVLPTLPATSNRVVGPVTGLPIDEDEDVFVLRLGKRYNNPNDMSRLQIEVRLPKELEKPMDVCTQFQDEDYLPLAPAPETKDKMSKKKKGKGGKKGKKGKK